MRTFNLSPRPTWYYSQRNNELDPQNVCKPTATVEALALAGWRPPRGVYRQPEDNLTAICRSEEAEAVMLSIDPALKDTQPNEVWGVVAWAVNTFWFPGSKPVIGPRWNWQLRDVLWGITQGRPFAASTWLTRYGHVVAVVGYTTEQEDAPDRPENLDMTKVLEIIIDDPYGDRTSGKYDLLKTGWNNRYSMADWLPLWRGIGIQIRRKA